MAAGVKMTCLLKNCYAVDSLLLLVCEMTIQDFLRNASNATPVGRASLISDIAMWQGEAEPVTAALSYFWNGTSVEHYRLESKWNRFYRKAMTTTAPNETVLVGAEVQEHWRAQQLGFDGSCASELYAQAICLGSRPAVRSGRARQGRQRGLCDRELRPH